MKNSIQKASYLQDQNHLTLSRHSICFPFFAIPMKWEERTSITARMNWRYNMEERKK